jgi:hypothetical protein
VVHSQTKRLLDLPPAMSWKDKNIEHNKALKTKISDSKEKNKIYTFWYTHVVILTEHSRGGGCYITWMVVPKSYYTSATVLVIYPTKIST